MEVLKINFVSFWPHFNKYDNFFTNLLSKKYVIEISETPDLLFCLNDIVNPGAYLKYNCHKIFFGAENERADWTAYDYVIDCDFSSKKRHKRFPFFATHNIKELTKPKNVQKIFDQKTKFACMVVSNGKARERIKFFNELSRYKKVDSAGKFMNNIGYRIKNKLDFIKDYKFVISFENSAHPGYTTEKLIEPMFVNSIPIYWGNPKVHLDFNTKSFINIHGEKDWESAIERIMELDQNKEIYLEVLSQPWFKENKIPEAFKEDNLLEFLEFVISDSKLQKPVSRTHKRHLHYLKRKKRIIFWIINKKTGLSKSFR